jgi:DNA processing protein
MIAKGNSNKIKYYVGFSYLFLRPLFKAKLFEFFDYDVERAYCVNEKDLEKFSSETELSIPRDFIKKRDKLDLNKCMESAFSSEDVGIVTYEDEKFPPLLRQIPDFPLALYYKGDIENICYDYPLAVVGSRKATTEAKNSMSAIINGLAKTPVVVVSGLAYGIDATAHRAALSADIKTIAIIASGLDIIYPTQNTQLYNEILEKNGVIFTEYPLKTEPQRYSFPQRNRIVVGMSKGTFVVEAQKKSGAMISANLTLDYNRELMCMPGNVLNPNTEGIYYLIKNGAGIVCYTKDILEIMDWNFEITEKYNPVYDLDEVQKRVYEVMSKESKTFDELAQEAQIEASNLMVILTELELKGLIKQADNKFYKCIW